MGRPQSDLAPLAILQVEHDPLRGVALPARCIPETRVELGSKVSRAPVIHLLLHDRADLAHLSIRGSRQNPEPTRRM